MMRVLFVCLALLSAAPAVQGCAMLPSVSAADIRAVARDTLAATELGYQAALELVHAAAVSGRMSPTEARRAADLVREIDARLAEAHQILRLEQEGDVLAVLTRANRLVLQLRAQAR